MNDDTISRQAAIDTVMKFMPSLTTPDGCGQFDKEIYEAQEMFVDIGQALNDLPSAERRGRWEHYEHREPQYDIEGYKTWAEAYKCSNCGFIHTVIEDFGHYAFCPRCGARMEEGGE